MPKRSAPKRTSATPPRKMPKGRAPKAAETGARQLEIAQRRATVASNWAAGATYREIAQTLRVSIGTIASDIAAICEDLNAQSREHLGQIRMRQMRRYDVLINSNWGEALSSAKPVERIRAAEIVLKAMDAQNKLLGLNAAQAVDLTSDGQAINVVIKHIGEGEKPNA